jgi:acylphosphatase
MPDSRSILVRISGRVQGVGYRDWTQHKANKLGLSGWVRNLASGEVEALLSGSAEAVEAMVAACRRGPQLARVSDVKITETTETASGPFAIRYDR